MHILKGSIRHCASSELTACGSISGTSSRAGASMGTPPRRATKSARWAPVRVSNIATTLDFMPMLFIRIMLRMSTWRRALLGAAIVCAFAELLSAQPLAGQPAAENAAVRDEFVAAMQRIRLHQPDIPDSPALQHYAIHDFLGAARLRRDVLSANDNLDATIDAFLRAHAGQPVTQALRRDGLASLAQRRRWDWFLPRSADVVDPVLVCDRLEARLSTEDTQGLADAALARWVLPQKAPAECADAFAWLRRQGLLTAALAETRTRAALWAAMPRLAREFAADVPIDRRAALLQWSDLLDWPRAALNVLATHPSLAVDPEALASAFEKLARTEPAIALDLLPKLIARDGLPPELKGRLQRAAALGAAYDRDPRAIAAFNDVPQAAVDGQVQECRCGGSQWFWVRRDDRQCKP